MAASGYTPISLYYSSTAAATPVAGNLVNGELAINITDGKLYYKDNAGVVQVIADKAGTGVKTISFGTTGLTPSTATNGAVTVAGTLITSNGGTGLSSYTAGDLMYYASGTALSKLAIGTANYVLTSSGTAPQWVAASSITVGAAGSNTQVQYNNSGVLGASSNFTFDGTNIGLAGGTANGVAYLNGSKVLTTGSALTFNGTGLGVGASPTANYPLTLRSGSGDYTKVLDWGTQSGGSWGTITMEVSSPPYQTIINTSGLQFNISGSEQMRLTSTGLGIGTSSPSAPLHVSKSVAGDWASKIVNTNSTNGYGLYLQGAPNASTYLLGVHDGSNYGFVLTGDFKLGIGTSSPGARLSLGSTLDSSQSSITNHLALYSTTYGFGVTSGQLNYNSNGSHVFIAAGTEYMRLDASGNLGLGVTPSAWGSGWKAYQLGSGSLWGSAPNYQHLSCNAYYNGTNYIYQNTGAALDYSQSNGIHSWHTAPSGTAGNAITFTQAMTLDASGNLLLGTTTSTGLTTNQFQLGTTSNANSGVQVLSNTTGTGGIYFGDSTSGAGRYSGYLEYNHSTNAMLFTTDATERMRIDSSGNVGIGTSSPGAKLEVKTAGSSFDGINVYSPSTTNGSRILFNNNYNSCYVGGVPVAATLGTDLVFGTTGSERMRLDSSGNLGLGVTPSAWATLTGFDITTYGSVYAYSNQVGLTGNAYYNSGWKYKLTGSNATYYSQSAGQHIWQTAPSGTAGNAISFTQAMTLDTSGNLGIGTSSPSYRLDVKTADTTSYGINVTNSNSHNGYIGFSADYQFDVNAGGAGGNWLNLKGGANGSSGGITLWTYGAERMRIDSSGNVGIGTSSPSGKLQIDLGNLSTVGAKSNSGLNITGNSGAIGNIYQIGFGYATGATNVPAAIYAITTSNAGFNYNDICFATRSVTTDTAPTERMRIDSTGNVTIAQAGRATITTDNDGSFDMNAASNFKCTPTGTFALTFTNIASAGGQSGYILLVNTGGYAITAAATTKVGSSFLSTVSTAGTYLLSYFSDATNVYVTTSGALS